MDETRRELRVRAKQAIGSACNSTMEAAMTAIMRFPGSMRDI
jgi:hypothetical protein